MLSRLAALALLAAPHVLAQPASLVASLDLRAAQAEGWLAGADAVGLRGDAPPLSWDRTLPAADPDSDGLYDLTVPFADVGDSLVVELKIKVDGPSLLNDGWQEGENHAVTLRRGETTRLELGWADRPAPRPGVVTGRVETHAGIGGDGVVPRDVRVWLPPGYDASGRRYPVLYLHDGERAFGTQSGGEWGMDEAATALVEAGAIEPLVIVGVASSDRRTDDYTPTRRTWRRPLPRTGPPTAGGERGAITGTFAAGPADSLVVALREGAVVFDPPETDVWLVAEPDGEGGYRIPGTDVTLAPVLDDGGAVPAFVATRPDAGGLADAYGAYLVDVVKPLVDARYRTLPDAAHTGVGGVSLGGLVTVHLGLTRPDVFGRLLVASPSVWWDEGVILRRVAEAEPRPEQRVWVDIGGDEGGTMVPQARELAELLVATGWADDRVRFVLDEGAGHEWGAWRARAPDMLRFLFPAEAE